MSIRIGAHPVSDMAKVEEARDCATQMERWRTNNEGKLALMSNRFYVSHSKAKLWRKCRRAYWYRYVEKLRRKIPARPLQFGRIVHRMIEAYANADDPWSVWEEIRKSQGKMFRSQREEYGEILDDSRVIMKDYFDYWESKGDVLRYTRMKGKASEHRFEVEIAPGIVAEGKLDNLAKYKGNRALVEHKSGRSFPNEDHRWRDIQSALYVRVVELLKLPPVDGVLWDFIRSKPPALPKVLKNGSLTRRPLDTLPARVADFIKQRNEDPKRFKTLIDAATKNRSSYFKRTFLPIKDKVVQVLFNDFVETAQEMKELHGKRRAMSIDRHCDWCEYEPLCRAELQGLDVKFTRSKDYEIAPFHEREDPDFEA